MAKTLVTAVYSRPNGKPVRGKVEFLVVPADYQDFETAIITSPVVVTLAANGGMSVQLLPTSGDDADWSDDVIYQVTERIKDTAARKYFVDVPTSASPVRLGTLTALVNPDPDPDPETAFPSSSTFPSSSLFPG